jgi:hypothetical protein
MQLSKKGEKCQLDPNRDSFFCGFGERRACASSEQVFFGCDNKLRCSRWEEFAGHTTISWQQTREKWNQLVLLNCLLCMAKLESEWKNCNVGGHVGLVADVTLRI